MEISQFEINKKRKEIEELAGIHKLEDWQKERLFQEYVRRKSMGYELSIIDLAKEWGWAVELPSSIAEPIVANQTEDAYSKPPEKPLAADKEDRKEGQEPEMGANQETVSTVEKLPVEEAKEPVQESQEIIEQPEPQIQRQEIEPQTSDQTYLAQSQSAFEKMAGYKPKDPVFNSKDAVSNMVQTGSLEESRTWIAQLVQRFWEKIGIK